MVEKEDESADKWYFLRITHSEQSGICVISDNQIQIYPNPVKDILIINNEHLQLINNVEICDLLGKTLSTHSTNKINVSNLPKGVYLVKIYTDKGVKVERVIKN